MGINRRKKICWSPAEVDWLIQHKKDSINQLTIGLQKSRTSIKAKLAELSGKPLPASPVKSKRSYIGKRPDLGISLRSSMEANILRVLLQDPYIIKVEYEPEDFTFWQFGHKKGTLSYTPDFKVWDQGSGYRWIEVKGNWLEQKDKTKIRRFKRYYPEEFAKFSAITPSAKSKTTKFFQDEGVPILWFYLELAKQYKNIIENWE